MEENKQKGPPMAREIKDSVFSYLFSDKEYQLELYRALHPESEIIADDIKLKNLKSVLVVDLYNDLCLMVKGKLFVFVEAQSTFCLNLAMRIGIYTFATLKRWIDDAGINLFRGRSEYPYAECYAIYTGNNKKVPDEIDLSELLPWTCLKIKILKGDDKPVNNIIYQYVRFCKISDEMRIRYPDDKNRAIRETIKKCLEEGILVDFLQKRMKEVIDAMDLLFDQQLVLENYIKDVVAQGKAEGKAEGRAEGEEKKAIAVAKQMLLLGVNTLDQIALITGLSEAKLQELNKNLN